MVDKCSSYSKMSVFETLDFLAPLEMTTGCYEASLLLAANARGGTFLTIKCPAPRTHRVSNAGGLPRGCWRL